MTEQQQQQNKNTVSKNFDTIAKKVGVNYIAPWGSSYVPLQQETIHQFFQKPSTKRVCSRDCEDKVKDFEHSNNFNKQWVQQNKQDVKNRQCKYNEFLFEAMNLDGKINNLIGRSNDSLMRFMNAGVKGFFRKLNNYLDQAFELLQDVLINSNANNDEYSIDPKTIQHLLMVKDETDAKNFNALSKLITQLVEENQSLRSIIKQSGTIPMSHLMEIPNVVEQEKEWITIITDNAENQSISKIDRDVVNQIKSKLVQQ